MPTTPTTAPDNTLLQGTLDLLILKTLSWGPRHGYAIA
jgi:PadR family transcriptional regulator PadR